MQNHRVIQQSRSSAIKIQIQHPTPKNSQGSKYASTKASVPQKSSQDVIRHLKQDLDRYKDENEELRQELTEITQSYLLEKSKVQELSNRVGSLTTGNSTQQRAIERMVEKQVAAKYREIQKVVEDQKITIQKYRKYKMCLSKNVYELQDRLKATRQELHQTQKQLFSLQQAHPEIAKELIPKKNASHSSENASHSSKKSNKIQHMTFDKNSDAAHEKPQDPSIPTRQARYLQSNQPQGSTKTSKVIRNGMQVAKSLALARGQQKYDWLFNDEETPRQQPENMLSERDSARYPTINTGKKLVSSRQEGVAQSNVSDLQTMASTNNKSIINQKMKHPQNNNYEDFSQTIESNREGADDSQLIINQQKSSGMTVQEDPQRHSIVKKSLNNVKSIIKKAKDGLKASGQGESIGDLQRKFYSNPFEVNHEQVQIELGGSIAAEGQKFPQELTHGQYSVQEPLKANKSLINEIDDQNPMDDDSN